MLKQILMIFFFSLFLNDHETLTTAFFILGCTGILPMFLDEKCVLGWTPLPKWV